MRCSWLAAAGLAAALGILSGCDTGTAGASPGDQGRTAGKPLAEIEGLKDAALIAQGRTLFENNCAQCHGTNAVGATNWRQRQPDGSFPPPPLNGTAHAWHHPLAQLRAVIREGSPSGNMPAWSGRLTEREIDAVIAYFHSLWPEEAYEAWYGINRRAAR